MSTLVMCPSCGQTTSVDPTAGGRVTCRGCGKSLGRPDPSTLPPPEDTAEPDELTAAVAAAAPRRPRRRARRSWAMPSVAAAVAVALAGGGLWAGYALSRPSTSVRSAATLDAEAAWEAEHRADFFRLKSEAESHVVAGDLTGGHERYRQLMQLAGGHAIHDPALYDLVNDAKGDQQRVFGMLLTKQEAAMGYYNAAAENPTVANTGAGASNTAGVATSGAAPAVAPAGAGTAAVPNGVAPAAPAGTSPADQVVAPSSSPLSPGPSPSTGDVKTTVIAPPAGPALTPAVPRQVILPGQLADRQVGAALDKGVDYLVNLFRGGEINDGRQAGDTLHQGLDALCVYALLHAGQASKDPRLNPRGPFLSTLIDTLKGFSMGTDPARPLGPDGPTVYARSLRAAALAVYDRPEDRAVLRLDVNWLVHAQTNGAYTYDDRYAGQSTRAPANGRGNGGRANGPQPGGQGMATPHDWRAVLAGWRPPSGTVADQLIDNGEPRGLPLRPPAPGNSQRPPGITPAPPPTAPRQPSGTPYRGGFLPPNSSQPPGQQPTAPLDPLQSDSPPAQPVSPGSAEAPARVPWDNSNSQYGLLGVWAGAEAGVEVPQAYWKAVEQHWLSCELKDGQWYYADGQTRPRLSMTCAGVASLLVTHEWLDPAALGTRVGRPPYSPALTAGLGWLESGDHAVNVDGPDTFYLGYSAYGVERCGLASGFKFLGTHDWFADLSAKLLPYQFPDGGWGQQPGTGTTVNTAYMVLFLSRGRHPVLMNKLRMDPYWDNRPRDLANLTTFASKELERPFNWQTVSFARPWYDWADAPVLYLASHVPPKLTADDEAKLKAYADAGGLIFTHADSGSVTFSKWADDLAKRLWPDLGGLAPLHDDHGLYSVVYHLKSHPKLLGLSNGSRLLMVHSPTDLSPTWQERITKGPGRDTFGLGVNLFVWAAGKADYRHRLDTPYIPDPEPTATNATTAAVPVARLRYPGLWDPEPYAWHRFANYFQWTTHVPVTTTTVDLPALRPGQTPVAVLTGTTRVTFTDADATAVRNYVTAGGTLLVDACGGSPAFAASAEALLGHAFVGVPLAPLPDADPLVHGTGPNLDDLTRPAVRPFAAEQLPVPAGSPGPPLRGLTAGTGRVVYSRLDLTTALLDTQPWGLLGYTPTYAQAAVKNVLLTAANPPVPQP